MSFDTRYRALNQRQQQAVDTTEGPVMVVAGPGTGKTELLSMRAANILRTTDTLPQNILCLTFTESGATAMRARLADIIGRDAYKVPVQTFHSFGSDVIANNYQYFYRGAEFQPADEIKQLELLQTIFDGLDHTNPLAGKMNGEYVYLNDTLRAISELKRSGLTDEELRAIIDDNEAFLDAFEPEVQDIFSARIAKTMLPILEQISIKAAEYPSSGQLPRGLTSLSTTFSLALAHAIDEAGEQDSTKPLTKWKTSWLAKDEANRPIFKSRARHAKLRAVAQLYADYIGALEAAGLYDFDDMILQVIHAVETQPELKYNLQEQHQYIMVDEFQDTNLAQLRLLLNLVDNPATEGQPNLLVVGDDDQAIYSFQGAEVGNILQLRWQFPSIKTITLQDNYRSAPVILDHARDVITQSGDRLEQFDESLDKTLHPHVNAKNSHVTLTQHDDTLGQLAHIADNIAKDIKTGTPPDSIAVLARKHRELVALLPYLDAKGIRANYQRQNNILELEPIIQLELLTSIIVCLEQNHLDQVDAQLPELLSHPAWGITTDELWQLSLKAYQERRLWSDIMANTPAFQPLWNWLQATVRLSRTTPLEPMIDRLLGSEVTDEAFRSPLFDYFFADQSRQQHPVEYLTFLEALRALRDELRAYDTTGEVKLEDLLEFIELHRQFDRPITSTHQASQHQPDAIHLLTAHGAKGLEFDDVYVIGLDDKTWGRAARSRSAKISYPENLPLTPQTGSVNEQLRLLYVAMTRAKHRLSLHFSQRGASGKDQLLSEFLLSETLPVTPHAADSPHAAVDAAKLDWNAAPTLTTDLKELLAPILERYRLSSTHINTFIDLERGGPAHFLLQNLLHFPSAPSPTARYGTAIHETLQLAQNHLLAHGSAKPLEDSLHDFEAALQHGRLSDKDKNFYSKKGVDSLRAFLDSPFNPLTPSGKAELDFGAQGIEFDGVRLTGKLDLSIIDPETKTIRVIDYKTGKPSRSWTGKTDYEKIKLHKYRQQLMFYRLLLEHSPRFSGYSYQGELQFVEPAANGEIVPPLVAEFSEEDYSIFKQLVKNIWHHIINLDLPAIDDRHATYQGILQFEQDIIDKK